MCLRLYLDVPVVAAPQCFGLKPYLLKHDTDDKGSGLPPPQPCCHHGRPLPPVLPLEMGFRLTVEA